MTRAEEWLCNIEKMKQKIKENGIEDVHRIMLGLEYSFWQDKYNVKDEKTFLEKIEEYKKKFNYKFNIPIVTNSQLLGKMEAIKIIFSMKEDLEKYWEKRGIKIFGNPFIDLATYYRWLEIALNNEEEKCLENGEWDFERLYRDNEILRVLQFNLDGKDYSINF